MVTCTTGSAKHLKIHLDADNDRKPSTLHTADTSDKTKSLAREGQSRTPSSVLVMWIVFSIRAKKEGIRIPGVHIDESIWIG